MPGKFRRTKGPPDLFESDHLSFGKDFVQASRHLELPDKSLVVKTEEQLMTIDHDDDGEHLADVFLGDADGRHNVDDVAMLAFFRHQDLLFLNSEN